MGTFGLEKSRLVGEKNILVFNLYLTRGSIFYCGNFYHIMSKNRTERIIGIQYKKYEELRSEIPNRIQWLKEYGVYLFRRPSDPKTFYGLVVGPEATLYQGGLILVKVSFPIDYPFSPPKIENLLTFPRQFNTNLWSNDVKQSLLTNKNEYQDFYGLICMDILNTPHSKITTNSYGEQVEVYDKSLEQYSPVLTVNTILMALRSNILNGETRCSYVTDKILKYLTLVYLGHHCFQKVSLSEYRDLVDYDGKTIQEVVRELVEYYNCYYKTVAKELLESEEEIRKEVKEFENEVLKSIIQ